MPQAEKATATLILQADGPTHSGRNRRLDAVKAGWAQSCEQQQENCGDDQSVALAEPSARHVEQSVPEAPPTVAKAPAIASDQTATVQMPDIPGPLDDMPSLNSNGGSKAIGPAVIDRLPRLSGEATPSKFDRFVYDEAGVFDPVVRDKLQAIAFQFAAAANVEVVTLAVKDLQGRDPDRYALDFMRQMRVGKLDVGNGAVLVVAPDTKQVGVALGPGLQVLFENDDSPRRRLQSFVNQISEKISAQRISSTLAGATYRVMSQSKPLEWSVRHPSFADYDAVKRKNQTDHASGTIPFDPEKDAVFQKLLRFEATIVSKSPDMNDRNLAVNKPRSRFIGFAVQVRTPDRKDVVLYVNDAVPTLIPVPWEEGKHYAFIARDTILKTGAPQLDLISYDMLQ